MTGGYRTEGPDERIARLEERMNASDRRAEESIQRMNRLEEDRRRTDGRVDRLFYTIIGLGVAVVAALVAGLVAG